MTRNTSTSYKSCWLWAAKKNRGESDKIEKEKKRILLALRDDSLICSKRNSRNLIIFVINPWEKCTYYVEKMKGSKALLLKRLCSRLKLFLDRIEKSHTALTHIHRHKHILLKILLKFRKNFEQNKFHPKALQKVFQWF